MNKTTFMRIIPLIAAFTVSLYADIISVSFTADVSSVGSALSGSLVEVGDQLIGNFSYDTDELGFGGTYAGINFDITIGGDFSVSSASSTLRVQDNQQNGSATLPADGLTFGGTAGTSDLLNGRTANYWQFGLRKENSAGQLWNDVDQPDLNDWAQVALSDITAPDWHWMQFERNADDQNIFASQIRWEVTGFTASSTSQNVPEPAVTSLLICSVLGMISFIKRKS